MTLKTVFVLCGFLAIEVISCSPGQSQEPSQETQTPAPALETLIPKVYAVAELNQRLRDEAGMSPEDARVWIESRVRSVLRHSESELLAQSGNISKAPSLIGVETAAGETLQVSLDQYDRGVLVSGDEVFVIATEDELSAVRNLIKTFEQFGVRQVLIRTLVLRDSVEAMKKMPINWSHVEAVSRIAQDSQQKFGVESNVRPAAFEQPAPRTTAAAYLDRTKPQKTEDLPPPPGVTSATWTEATSIVERATPVLYTLLSPVEYQSVLAHVKQAAAVERVMSPTVVVFNGQVATISDSVERPFVTGIKPVLIGSGEAKQVEFAPSIKVYPEGTTLKLQPALFEGSRVRLNCQLDLCKVRAVETLDIAGIAGRNDFTVQMPEVASTQFRTCLDMPINYTLAISAFENDDQGQKRSIVILCHCSLRDVESLQK